MSEFFNTPMAIVPQSFLQEVLHEIRELKGSFEKKTNLADEWIESKNVPGILSISQKTWQTYRDKRIIPFSQIGQKIYVKRSDLEQFMTDHYITANK